jgi:ABC-type bacteriocin/lantibiotic exporter with double-glycine peptidase domain
LLRGPTLLILDEAINAIDIAGERAILTDLAKDVARRTVVIVARRAETLAPCGRLLRFADGQLVEDRALVTPAS